MNWAFLNRLNKKNKLLHFVEHYQIDNCAWYKYIQIKKNNNEIVHLNALITDDFNEIKTLIPSLSSVCVILNTSKVLTKILPAHFANKDIKIKQTEAFSSIHIQDFKISSSQNVISIIRKDEIHRISQLYKDRNYFLTHLFLGIVPLTTILSTITEKEIYCSSMKITLDQKMISDVTSSDQTPNRSVLLQDTPLDEEFINVFSAGVSIILQQEKDLKDYVLAHNRVNRNYFVWGRAVLLFGGLFMFFLLLINAFLYVNYSNKNSLLQAEEQVRSAKLEKVKLLKKKLETWENLESSQKIHQNSHASKTLDQIASTVPSTIQLSHIRVNPKNKRQSGEELTFTRGIVEIGGVSLLSKAYAQWENELRQLQLVRSCETIYYGQLNRKEAKFDIRLTLNDQRLKSK